MQFESFVGESDHSLEDAVMNATRYTNEYLKENPNLISVPGFLTITTGSMTNKNEHGPDTHYHAVILAGFSSKVN